MSNIPNHMLIAIGEIKGKLKESDSIKDRLTMAMRLAKNHWVVTKEDEQFRCAVGAVLLTASVEEKAIISQEMNMIKSLSSAISGVPVDFSAVFERADTEKFYGLLPMWKEMAK